MSKDFKYVRIHTVLEVRVALPPFNKTTMPPACAVPNFPLPLDFS